MKATVRSHRFFVPVVAICVLSIVFVSLGIWLRGPSQDRPLDAPERSGVIAEGSTYEQRFQSIENSVADIQQNLAKISESLAERNNRLESTVEGARVMLGEPGPEPENEQHAFEERVSIIEQAMVGSGPDDLAWAAQTEIHVSSKISESAILNAASSHQTRCAGTICKVSVELPTEMDSLTKEFYADELLMALGSELPRGTFQTHTNPDGSVRLEFYLARTGYVLPSRSNPDGGLDAPPPPPPFSNQSS